MAPATDLLADLEARGLVQDATDRAALAARLAAGPVTLYHGMDPTADSLHTGNLIGLVMLRRFQLAGHRPLALAGGATGMVGDPSGRSEERNLLDEATLRRNVEAISAQIGKVLGDGGGWELVNNHDWTKDVSLLDFLRDVGKHVTVNQMVARESVKARMGSEHGISFTEFSYMLLQAYDYWWLHEHKGCELQVGGSDQWGNILSGVELIRRRSGAVAHALAWPLLTAPDGTKLGKTTGARIWLDPAKTSPYRFYQHWVQTDDRQVRRLLCWFTLLAVPAIDALVARHEAAPQRREAQRVLAREVTSLVHGAAAAQAAEAASAVLFGGDPVAGVGEDVLAVLAAEVPSLTVSAERLAAGLAAVDALVELGLARSKGEARRLADQGGLTVGDSHVGAESLIDPSLALHGRYVVLRKGKRDYAIVVVA